MLAWNETRASESNKEKKLENAPRYRLLSFSKRGEREREVQGNFLDSRSFSRHSLRTKFLVSVSRALSLLSFFLSLSFSSCLFRGGGRKALREPKRLERAQREHRKRARPGALFSLYGLDLNVYALCSTRVLRNVSYARGGLRSR